jgi:hypothetical protein
MTDSLLSYYGHPVLPAGYNSWELNGDELNGAGANEPTWPYLLDAFIPLEVLIITPEMLDVFDGCPDFVAPCEPNLVMVPVQQTTYTPAAPPPAYVPAAADAVYAVSAVDNLIVFPAEQRTLVITEEAA